MKRKDLIGRIAKQAKVRDLDWRLARQGGSHEVWELDGKPVTIPRLNELTATGIMKHVEDKLGARWRR